MPQVQVMIGGRSYRLACNPGEEAHLQALAAEVEGKISQMRGTAGEIGDQRIVVMTALSFADELYEAKREAAASAQAAEAARTRVEALEATIAETTQRLATLAQTLNAPAPD